MNKLMSTLHNAMNINGAISAVLLDYRNSKPIYAMGKHNSRMEECVIFNTDIIRSNIDAMNSIGFNNVIEDTIITTNSETYLIRLVYNTNGHPEAFICVSLNRSANIKNARLYFAKVNNENAFLA